MIFDARSLACPIVQAPMAGGTSTVALAAAVSEAGGLGFLAAGYTSVDTVRSDLDRLRSQIAEDLPYGVNLFVPSAPGDPDAIARYADALRPEAAARGVDLGVPTWDDDGYPAKLELLCSHQELAVPVVSFTFGCPSAADVRRLHAVGSAVWITVTTPDEARIAQQAGADALVVQGFEAGGHRGGFDDTDPGDVGLLALLQLVAAATGDVLPLIAAGGLSTGRAVAGVLAAGATAAQLGTSFLLSPEAGTGAVHREVLAAGARRTALTRAFTGRTARSLRNRFLAEHSERAPSAYPEVHHLTGPLRAAARSAGDAEGFHLWAGQAYGLAQAKPAAEIVRQLTAEAEQALRSAAERLS